MQEARVRRAEREWREAEGDALNPQAYDLIVGRDGRTTTLEPGPASGGVRPPSRGLLGRIGLVGLILNDLGEWGRTLFAHQERIPILHDGQETGLRIVDGHGEFSRLEQLVDGKWQPLDVDVGRNVVSYEVGGADLTEGRYVVDGGQLARAYIGEVDPDLTSYYRQQFVDLNGSQYRPGYVDIEVPVADLNWDFRDFVAAIDYQENRRDYVQLARLSDSSPNLLNHSGPIGRSWTFGDDLRLSVSFGLDIKQRYGLPDGLLPAPGGVAQFNDAGYVTFGLVRDVDVSTYGNPFGARPWPNMAGVPNRRSGGGPEVLFQSGAQAASIVRARVTVPFELFANGVRR